MRIHLQDSKERRHYPIKRLATLDSKIEAYYTGTFSALEKQNLNPHKHTFLEIMFIDSGSGTIEINNIKYKAKTDDIILYFPSNMHKEYSDNGTIMHALFFAVKYKEPLKKMFANCNEEYILHTGTNNKTFRKLFNLLIQESKNEELNYTSNITNCIAKTIILKILQLFSSGNKKAATNEYVQKIQDYLDKHYLEEIDLDKYYETLPFSKYYIARLFKSTLGVTPVNYIISKRIDHAKTLLNKTDMKIINIANEVGYKDIYYFTKVFKKEVGVSPSSYRKRSS
ncbi:MAG: helix-turn-helix transcriptional regulator [Bacilli bacterium]|nr:helix-turn-helix transcriptional regulator [Bacilli bacterium]MBR1582061.1 helix-turn-helix transcriptional regulator [Bacilli bacterium]